LDSKVVSRIWWAVGLRGILAILFGIMALIFTGQTLLALVYVFGAFALIAGLAEIVTAMRAGEAHMRWGWLAFAGIISVAAGILSFVWPGITAVALLFLIAAWALVTGVAEIIFALSWPDTLAHPWLAALSGALSVVFGILLVVWPRSGVIALTWLVGIYAILYGISQLYYLFRLQGLRREVRQTFGGGTGAPAAS
jgi:uncharacterized membrane protein HdeD (DUF308 family)